MIAGVDGLQVDEPVVSVTVEEFGLEIVTESVNEYLVPQEWPACSS
jgi:hypothetical protein